MINPQEVSISVAILAGILGIGFSLYKAGTHNGEIKHETRISLSEQAIKTVLERIQDLTKDMSVLKDDVSFIKQNIVKQTSARRSRARAKAKAQKK